MSAGIGTTGDGRIASGGDRRDPIMKLDLPFHFFVSLNLFNLLVACANSEMLHLSIDLLSCFLFVDQIFDVCFL